MRVIGGEGSREVESSEIGRVAGGFYERKGTLPTCFNLIISYKNSVVYSNYYKAIPTL